MDLCGKSRLKYWKKHLGSRDGAVVRALASHQCGPGLIPRLGIMWVEFVVGSRPCSESFFSGYSGFSLSSKTNTSKFQFNLESVHMRIIKQCSLGGREQ